MIEINFATSNKNKVREFQQILDGKAKIAHILVEYPEIKADTNEEVAKFSAELLANKLKKPIVVEDSGLFITALNGFPGTCSAYVHKKIGLSGILRLMDGVKVRNCTYKSAVAYCKPGEKAVVFLGEEKGIIANEERGNYGFGHDPIFIPEDSNKTYGEIENCEKFKKFRRIAVLKFIDFKVQ